MPRAASVQLERPEGRFELRRYPHRSREPLQAWCGADLLLLDAAAESDVPASDVLVVNDDQGALATVLQPRASWTDSALSAIALEENLERNGLNPVAVRWSTETPGDGYRLVIMRIPKHLDYFEYQLARLKQSLSPGAQLVCGGMDKHLSPHTAALIERYFPCVTRHRGSRKARLFSTVRDNSPAEPLPPRPSYYCEPLSQQVAAGANVFSPEGLDIGTRLLLTHLPELPRVQRAADLACGNGVLGLAAMKSGLCSEMRFFDESAMAIEAARDNCRRLFSEMPGIHFHHGDGLLDTESPFDLIVCNPPFHLGHSVDDFAGRRLLHQCATRLSPDGALCVVANQHLPYLPILRRKFSQVKELGRNRKFAVWLAHTGC